MIRQELILQDAIRHYGKEHQLNVAIEKMSELIKEICKYKRYYVNRKEITEEMADVYVMLWQMELIFANTDEVCKVMNEKIRRLNERLKNEQDGINATVNQSI